MTAFFNMSSASALYNHTLGQSQVDDSQAQILTDEQTILSDEQLVVLAATKDQEYFSQLVMRWQDKIYGYLFRLLNFNTQDAQDVTAETFYKAFVNLNGFNPNLKFSSWLYRIAHNEAVNLIKKKSHVYSVDIQEMEIAGEPDFDHPAKSDLEGILARLSLDDRNLLTLFYLEDRSMREIAEIFKISENNVAVKLNRARNRAKEIVRKYHL